MPTYTFKDKNTNEEFDRLVKFEEYDDYLKDNPNYERVMKPVRIVSGVGFSIKTDNGFRDVLKRIEKGSGRSNTIDTGNLGEI